MEYPITRVTALFFSPTFTTRKCATAIARAAHAALNRQGIPAAFREINITTPLQRKQLPDITSGDLVIFGVPVYIGRVPNLLKKYFASIPGNGAIGVPLAVYGNRAFDDCLIELRDLMTDSGFRCIAAGAFIGEHSFSYRLGAGRPDEKDLSVAAAFGEKIAARILEGNPLPDSIAVPGNPAPYAFFNARDAQGRPIDLRKVKPETDPERCDGCGICAMLCPMGAIDFANCAVVSGTCIRCGACIKKCRRKAKYFSDPVYLEHKKILEDRFTETRKEPELFF